MKMITIVGLDMHDFPGTRTVPGAIIRPGLAITRYQTRDGRILPYWVITHVGSGCALVGYAFPRLVDARDFVRALPRFDWTKPNLIPNFKWLRPRVRRVIRQFGDRAIPWSEV